MSNLTIYSASAGSGKTFNLVAEYISTLMEYLQDGKQLGFKTVLAVTFTNASTKEMKDRIIDVLLSLSKNEENNYLSVINEKTHLDEKQIVEYSNKILTEIIHNYSFFNISTIDSFFQLVLRNMAKELGIGNGFSIILDDKEYNSKAVKNIIKLSKEDSPQGNMLSNVLYKYFLKRQDDNKSWNFTTELENILASLNNNDVIDKLNDKNNDVENLLKIEATLKKNIKEIKDKAKEYQTEFLDRCKELGLNEEDFKGGVQGIYYKVEHHLTELKDKYLVAKLVEGYFEGKEYVKKGSSPRILTSLIEEIDSFLQEKVEEYRSLLLFYNNIYPLALIKTLYNEKTELLKQDENFVLKNTKQVLRGLSLQEDNYSDKISFIYEKIGTYLKSIMIDEFQDTSSLDWYNLEALINECLSEQDGKAFIFGDTKQSIYRWNNGDWRILQGLTQNKNNEVKSLKNNFRTFEYVVNFNNSFFSSLFDEYENQVIKPKQEGKGSVRIDFLSKDDDILQRTVDEIDFYLQKGYMPEDIAILCRETKHITMIAEHLKNLDIQGEKTWKYNPISDDAFMLSSSGAVKLIITAMRYLADKNRNICKELIIKEKPLSLEKIEEIRPKIYSKTSLFDIVAELAEIFNIDDTVFMPAFYDSIKNFINNFSGNLNDFLDYWDSTLKTQKVETSAQDNSLRLCTIHKSKGLEFPVVIIPYFSWATFKSNETKWIFNKEKKVANISVLRCNLSELQNTYFDDIYQEEKEMQRRDNINLLYVALTRPKEHLSILAIPTKTKQILGCETNVGNILYNYVISHKEDFKLEGKVLVYQNKETVCYKEEKETKDISLGNENPSMILSKNALVFSTPSESEYYFKDSYTELNKKKRDFGSMMHGFMSKISKDKDFNSQEEVFAKQYEHWEEIKEVYKQMLDFSREKHWFNGLYKIINERNILHNKEIKRPDRIMIKDDLVEIVDYKFAKFNEERHKKYSRQVKAYKELLQEMGYKNINSYLWYIDIDLNKELRVNQQIIEVK